MAQVDIKDLKKHKRCPKCKKIKHVREFYCNSQAKDGLQCYCRTCQGTNPIRGFNSNT